MPKAVHALPHLKSIGVVGNPWYRHFFAELASLLKKKNGSKVHVYCNSEEGCQLFREADRHHAFETVSVMPTTTNYVVDTTLDRDTEYRLAQSYERKYDLNYNWSMVPDRHFGRGYAPGGFHHPRSQNSVKGTYLDALQNYTRQIAFWENEIESKAIRLVMEVNNPMLATVASYFGAVVRNPTPSRHLNHYYWATDEFGYCSSVEEVYPGIAKPHTSSDLGGAPYQGAMFNREALRRFSLKGVLLSIIKHFLLSALWRVKGHHKARGYFLGDFVRLALRRRRDFLKLTSKNMKTLADLNGQRFVFYAMHVEPEIWFQGRSPEFFNQLSAIGSLSRDLPAGVLLAVKEHLPAIGRRPDLFYRQIAELKNVVLVDVRESGQDLVRSANAVATICGTVGQEAAVLGKPVIAFGRHNIYNILPHVQVITREEDLRPALERALTSSFDSDTARQSGLRFISAIARVSFDMKTFTARNLLGFDQESVLDAYERLILSLPNNSGGIAGSVATQTGSPNG